jgi:hypothetical protein
MNQNFKETLIKLFTKRAFFIPFLFTIIFISVSLTNVYSAEDWYKKEVSFEYKKYWHDAWRKIKSEAANLRFFICG